MSYNLKPIDNDLRLSRVLAARAEIGEERRQIQEDAELRSRYAA